MKNKKIIAVLIAAMTTTSALTSTVSAGWVREGDTPLIDTTPSASKSFQHNDGFYLVNKNGDKISGIAYGDVNNHDNIGFDMRMAEFDKSGRFENYYNSFTKDANGKRYYKNGVRAYGWRKLGGSWYHFDRKTGYMDTGRAKICGVTYVFDENGKWTGKVGKNGLCPDDFSLKFECTTLGKSGFSSDGTICYGTTAENELYSADANISKRDRQVLYCALLESGILDNAVLNIDYEYYSKRISEYINGEMIATDETLEPLLYTINITVGGNSYSLEYDADAKQIAHFDRDALDVYFLYETAQDYYKWLYYKNKPDLEVEMLAYV